MAEEWAEEWDHQWALAKLTLSLRVTGVRADGMHLVDAEMVSLDLADELWFAPGDSLQIDARELVALAWVEATQTRPLAPARLVGPTPAAIPLGDDNLVRRALRALGRRAAVRLVKRIPPGGGLGGGSTDAAAVLRWAGLGDGAQGLGGGAQGPGGGAQGPGLRGGRAHAPSADALALAAGLGADVPFCLVGGRARVSGVGEIVEALPYERRGFLLAMPPFGVSTARVYEAWDEMGGPAAPGCNDLEAPALAVEPRLAAWRDALGESAGAVPRLAGSGSTWYVEADPDADGAPGALVVGGEVGRLIHVRTVPGR